MQVSTTLESAFLLSVTGKTRPSSQLCHSSNVRIMPLALEAKEPSPWQADSQVSSPGAGDWSCIEFQILANTYIRLSERPCIMSYVSLLLADGKISIVCRVVPDFCWELQESPSPMYAIKGIYLFLRKLEAANCIILFIFYWKCLTVQEMELCNLLLLKAVDFQN